MQQKYLWGGAALFVFGAATAYITVDYAAHNPTSLLARFGMATLFAGMNPNPLSDINSAITGEPQPHANQGHSVTPTAHQPNGGKTISNPAEETIEPIQIETLPPPTKEPPLNIDDEEWASIYDAVRSQMGSLPDRAPKLMPYADENPDATPSSANVSAAVRTIQPIAQSKLVPLAFLPGALADSSNRRRPAGAAQRSPGNRKSAA